MNFNVCMINRYRMRVDGQGVTTLVGLAGCPLFCKYCINKNMLEKNSYVSLSPEKLWDKLKIDYCYFVATGGGITFGGGESILHGDAIINFKHVIPEIVNLTLETSLNVNYERLPELLENCHEFIIDIKTMDSEIYKAYTGISNESVMRNLKTIVDLKMQGKCKIRIPVIPGYTDVSSCHESEKIVRAMGFKNIEVFPYVIKD